MHQFNRYFVCLLDVLGFESRFSKLGLGGILDKYVQLIERVAYINEQSDQVAKLFEWEDGAYWTAEGAGFVMTRMYGAYASDSILLFADADFPENRYPAALGLSKEERDRRAADPATGWRYHTVPCDTFLGLCNDVVCHGIEIGLPLRGAIAMGEAVLNTERDVFLGQPLIDAVRLGGQQKCIGASLAQSFANQIVPARFQLPYVRHFKGETPSLHSGIALDWPRHWRKTRKESITDKVSVLDEDARFSAYYQTTNDMCRASEARSTLYEAPDDTYITRVYPQFSTPELELDVVAVSEGNPTAPA